MTHDFETLPDMLGALEQELRARAVRVECAAAPRRRSRWRPVAGVALAVSCALASLALLPGSLTRDSGTAFGQVPLLDTRPQALPPDLRDSASLRVALGPDGAPTQAWSFKVPNGTGWLMQGKGTWCLAVPDPDSGPDRFGMVCIKSESMQRYGIAGGTELRYVIAVPEGVANPVLHRADGSATELRPDDLGIVVVDGLQPGETITRYGTDGTSLTRAVAID